MDDIEADEVIEDETLTEQDSEKEADTEEETKGSVEDEEGESDEQDETLIPTIGDEVDSDEVEEDDQEDAPTWVKDLRAKQAEQRKEIRQLKKEKKDRDEEDKRRSDEASSVEVGEKPSSIDYEDDDEYDKDLLAWHGRKGKVADQKSAAEALEKKQNESWQTSLSEHEDRKSAMAVNDFTETEEDVAASLSQIQMHIIIKGSNKSEMIMYAIGKNKTVLDRLAAIDDPIEFAVEIGRIESQMKTRSGKKAPAPERRLKSGSGTSVMGDSTLENLEKEAEKTGDRSKIAAYKREQRNAA